MIALQQKKPAVIIAAHGSTATSNANRPFANIATSLMATGKFTNVIPAFLDGDVLIENAYERLDPTATRDVIVIPAMTSDGYYVNTVFPKKLEMNPNFADFNTSITDVIGVQGDLKELVVDRIRILAQKFKMDMADTTVFIVGHGTRRNSTSGLSTFDLAKATNKSVEASVIAAFIDQDPEIGPLRTAVETSNIIVIPFLMGMGPHVTDDVPEAFDLIGGPANQFPRYSDTLAGRIVCDHPLGSNQERVADICLNLAHVAIHANSRQEVKV